MFRAAANKRKKQKKIVPFIARNEMAWLRSNSAVLQNTDAFLHTVVAVGFVMFWVRFFFHSPFVLCACFFIPSAHFGETFTVKMSNFLILSPILRSFLP